MSFREQVGHGTAVPDGPAELVVRLDKSKICLLLLGAVAFVGLGIWFWSLPDFLQRYSALQVRIVAAACMSFFGVCAIYGVVKLCDPRPGLILDSIGIIDNSSAAAVGRINWEDIVGLKITSIADQKMVTIELADPQKYIQTLGVFARMLNSANTSLTGSPVNISANSLAMTFDELVNVIAQALEHYHRTADPT